MKIIIRAIGLGLVLTLILVLLSGCGEKGVSLVEELVLATQGGSIASSDGKIALEIPPGALAVDTTVSIRLSSEEELTDEIKDLSPLGPVYSLEPDGLIFEEPVTVKLALDSSLYSVGTDMVEVTAPLLYTTDGNGLPELMQDMVTVVSPEEAYIQGTTTHFSLAMKNQGSVTLIMQPEEVKLPRCDVNFTANWGIHNSSAFNIEKDPDQYGHILSNLTDVSVKPIAKPNVTVVTSGNEVVELFNLAPGDIHRENDILYHIVKGEGSYGIIADYYWAPVDMSEGKQWSVIEILCKVTCPSAEVTPPVTQPPVIEPPVAPPPPVEEAIDINIMVSEEDSIFLWSEHDLEYKQELVIIIGVTDISGRFYSITEVTAEANGEKVLDSGVISTDKFEGTVETPVGSEETADIKVTAKNEAGQELTKEETLTAPKTGKVVISIVLAAESYGHDEVCDSSVLISSYSVNVTGLEGITVTNVVLKVNVEVWDDSESISTRDYHNSVERDGLPCGRTFMAEVIATTSDGVVHSNQDSLTTPAGPG
ncbi:hypothetical protein ACFLTP_10120 [Chloroflexota bacterium]